MNLINGECLEELKKIENKSVDCFISDLPYGTTDCKWDNKIDLDELWTQMKRIARNDNTPFFFFCDFRFGIQLHNSNPKWFRYDLVWEKSAAVGFLFAKIPLGLKIIIKTIAPPNAIIRYCSRSLNISVIPIKKIAAKTTPV